MSTDPLTVAQNLLATAQAEEQKKQNDYNVARAQKTQKDTALANAQSSGNPIAIQKATSEQVIADLNLKNADQAWQKAKTEVSDKKNNLSYVQKLIAQGFTFVSGAPGAPGAPGASGASGAPVQKGPQGPQLDQEDKEALQNLYKKKDAIVNINTLTNQNTNFDVSVQKIIVMQPEAKKITTLQDAVNFLINHSVYQDDKKIVDGHIFYLDEKVYDHFEKNFRSVVNFCSSIVGKKNLPIEEITNEHIGRAFKGEANVETDRIFDIAKKVHQQREEKEKQLITDKKNKEPSSGYTEVVGIFIPFDINQQYTYNPYNKLTPLNPKFTFTKSVNPSVFIPKILNRTLKYFINDSSSPNTDFNVIIKSDLNDIIYKNLAKDIPNIKNEFELYESLLKHSLNEFKEQYSDDFSQTYFSQKIDNISKLFAMVAKRIENGIDADDSTLPAKYDFDCYTVFTDATGTSAVDSTDTITHNSGSGSILDFSQTMAVVNNTIKSSFLLSGEITQTGPTNPVNHLVVSFVSSFLLDGNYYNIEQGKIDNILTGNFNNKIENIVKKIIGLINDKDKYKDFSILDKNNNIMYYRTGILYSTFKLIFDNIKNITNLSTSDTVIDNYILFFIALYEISIYVFKYYNDNSVPPNEYYKKNIKENSLKILLKRTVDDLLTDKIIQEFQVVDLKHYENFDILKNHVFNLFYNLFNDTQKINHSNIDDINVNIDDINTNIDNFTNARCYSLESLYLSLKVITIICLLVVKNMYSLTRNMSLNIDIQKTLQTKNLSFDNIKKHIKHVFEYISLKQMNQTFDMGKLNKTLEIIHSEYLDIKHKNYQLSLWESIILGITVNNNNYSLSSYYDELKTSPDESYFTDRIKNTLIYDLTLIKYISDSNFKEIVDLNHDKDTSRNHRLFLMNLENSFLNNDIFFMSYFSSQVESKYPNHIGSLLSLSYEVLFKQLKDKLFKSDLDINVINLYQNYNKVVINNFYEDFSSKLSDSFYKDRYFTPKSNERRTSACFDESATVNQYDISLMDENLFGYAFDLSSFKNWKNIKNYIGFNSIIDKVIEKDILFINRIVVPHVSKPEFNHTYKIPMDPPIIPPTEQVSRQLFKNLDNFDSFFNLDNFSKIFTNYKNSLSSYKTPIQDIYKYTKIDNSPLFIFNKNYLIYIDEKPNSNYPEYKKLIYVNHNQLDKNCINLDKLNNTIEITFDPKVISDINLDDYIIKDISISINDNFILNKSGNIDDVDYRNTFNFYKDISDAEFLLKSELNKNLDYSDFEKLDQSVINDTLKKNYKFGCCRLINYNDFNKTDGILFKLIGNLSNTECFLTKLKDHYDILHTPTFHNDGECCDSTGQFKNNIVYNEYDIANTKNEKVIPAHFINDLNKYYDLTSHKYYERSDDIYKIIPKDTLTNATGTNKNVTTSDEKAQLLLLGFVKDMHELCESFIHNKK